ncbi:MAG: response regulator, partial [Verrucomicrobiota bacterium]
SQLILKEELPENVTFSIDLPDQAVCVHANPSQMQQLILNLCKNILQSLGELPGELTLRLIGGDDSCELVVYDSGRGISAEDLPYIFDPYYSSRQGTIGNGLGLAVVQQVVRTTGGKIEVTSEENAWTRFCVSLPTTDEPPELQTALPVVDDYKPEKKAILLVDDEPIMRGLGMDVLHSLGYRVSVAEDGLEALEMVKKNPEYFDLVLSDSKMPEMSGPELAEQLNSVKPELPFILVTAFNDAVTESKLKAIGVSEIVRKPFLIDSLAKALKKALEGT